MRTRDEIAKWLMNLFIVFIMLFWVVVPLVYGLGMAIKPTEEVLKVPPDLLPRKPTLDNFRKVISVLNVPRLFLNTLITAIVPTVTTLLFSTLAGYAFAKLRFFAKEQVFLLLILKLMLPEAVLIIPWFYLVGQLRLIDTLFAVMLPSLVGCWTVFFMRQFIYALPDVLLDSARMDGASEIRIFGQVIVPLIKPAVGAAVIVNLMFAWDWYLWPLIVLNSNDKYTLNLGVHFIRWLNAAGGEGLTDYGWLMAIVSIYSIPFLLFYLVFQRLFVESIALSGMKE